MFYKGWIKLHRKILESRHGGNLEMIGLWSVLVMMANHKKNYTEDGTLIHKGQFMTSHVALAKRFKVDRNKMRRMLKKFENAQQIKQRTSPKNTIITILNYSEYQEREQQDEHEVNIERTSGEHQVNTNKNENNVKNVKNAFSLCENEKTIFDNVVQLWNVKCAGREKLKHTRAIKPSTAKTFFELINLNQEFKKIATWSECFDAVVKSDFLNGSNPNSNFVCTLNWLIESHKIVDVLNGQFGGNKNESEIWDEFHKLRNETSNMEHRA